MTGWRCSSAPGSPYIRLVKLYTLTDASKFFRNFPEDKVKLGSRNPLAYSSPSVLRRLVYRNVRPGISFPPKRGARRFSLAKCRGEFDNGRSVSRSSDLCRV